nr:MAG TPA: hypothetical protein [Caudoviricetes sp.]
MSGLNFLIFFIFYYYIPYFQRQFKSPHTIIINHWSIMVK